MGGRGMGRREDDPEEIGRKETFDIWRTAVDKEKTEREKKEKAKRHFIIEYLIILNNRWHKNSSRQDIYRLALKMPTINSSHISKL